MFGCMLLRAIADEGCTDTVGGLEVDWRLTLGGNKIPCRTGDSKPVSIKPVLNWANVCSPEHASDTSTNYDSFLN